MSKAEDRKKERVIKQAIEARYGKHKRGARYSMRKLSGELIEEKIEEVEGEKDNGKKIKR